MRNLRPSPTEVKYQRLQFYESLSVQGIPCTLRSLKKVPESHDFYSDLVPDIATSHEDEFHTMITFDNSPSVQTLRGLGWYQDDSDGLPIIAHIPLLYMDESTGELTEFRPSIDDIVYVESNTDGDEVLSYRDHQEYLIQELKGMGFPNVIYYVAKLTPNRRDVR